jgi:epoxyqueuosine reductase
LRGVLILNIKEQLERKLIDWGSTFVGFSNVEAKVSQSLKQLGYAITVGVRLSDAIIDEIEDKPTFTYFHHYRTVNFFIDQLTLRGILYLQEQGFNAVAVPASQTVYTKGDEHCGIFPHKTAAVEAGLGWIGKNGLFISSDYGPRVRLGTILTNYSFENKEEHNKIDCGECNNCVKSCPAFALSGNNWEYGCDRSHLVDAKACSDYMNANFKHIGRGSVCGICVRVCPKGRKRSGQC